MLEPSPQPQPLTTIKTRPGSFPVLSRHFRTALPRDLNFASNEYFTPSCSVFEIIGLYIQTKCMWGGMRVRPISAGCLQRSSSSVINQPHWGLHSNTTVGGTEETCPPYTGHMLSIWPQSPPFAMAHSQTPALIYSTFLAPVGG